MMPFVVVIEGTCACAGQSADTGAFSPARNRADRRSARSTDADAPGCPYVAFVTKVPRLGTCQGEGRYNISKDQACAEDSGQ